ncbi:MAG TPA: DPP IV N-terminal domain-containing protein [Rhizomicrobium sp.]|jgi:dipeptidyl-peptidase-4|nr:DPP IV N-terminal domain-containing protein [Rhizomicrobium sp.]
MFRPVVLPFAAVAALAAIAPAVAKDTHCFDDVAATRGYTLGTPAGAMPAPDGKSILYLRSGPRDTTQRLFAYDLATTSERELITPEALLQGRQEHLSDEEKARRERARVSVRGFTAFSLSRDGSRVLLSLGGRLFVLMRHDGSVVPLPGEGWIAPQLSPDGTKVAALRDDDLHVIDIRRKADTQLTHGAGETLQHGEAEFVAQEEMDRRDGFWWSPDSRFLAYEEADLSPVEAEYVADPLEPQKKPVEFRYPRAGTANAVVRLGVISAAGGPTVWLAWDNKTYPYLARVEWTKGGPLALLVQNREQTEEKYFAADPQSGALRLLWTERNPAWLDLPAPLPKELPYWLADGSGFLWMTERGGQTQLERHAADGKLVNAVTPRNFRFDALVDVDVRDGTAVVEGGTDRLSRQIWRVNLKGGTPIPIAAARGLNTAEFGEQHAIFAHGYNLLDGSNGVDVLSRDGKRIAQLPAKAEKPPFIPAPEYFTVGKRGFDAVVLRPRDFDSRRNYPVILSVYGGPAAKLVWAAPRSYFTQTCMADDGYIVAISDNRGTPGRDSAWYRAVKGDAIDIPLEDQVDALRALGARVPQMDMARVGVFGWSFGGYFSAMATMRRPDVFAAGIAGAPVVDWQDYDTYYTERYMGLPAANADGYRRSNVLTYADQLRRPLLIIHGVTDDNVHFEHTMKLTLALLRAGKPYDLLLLPGTHMLADDLLRARETERQMDFLAAQLGAAR